MTDNPLFRVLGVALMVFGVVLSANPELLSSAPVPEDARGRQRRAAARVVGGAVDRDSARRLGCAAVGLRRDRGLSLGSGGVVVPPPECASVGLRPTHGAVLWRRYQITG